MFLKYLSKEVPNCQQSRSLIVSLNVLLSIGFIAGNPQCLVEYRFYCRKQEITEERNLYQDFEGEMQRLCGLEDN